MRMKSRCKWPRPCTRNWAFVQRNHVWRFFIAVRDGVRLIEYNARFGDPEAMRCTDPFKDGFYCDL